MKRVLAVAVTFLLAAALHAESLRGMWTASTWSVKDIERIQLNMNREHSNWGQDFKISALEGLSRAQITSATDVPVKSALRRNAGNRGVPAVGNMLGELAHLGEHIPDRRNTT